MQARFLSRVVLHLDMDAFYAAVEVREDPSLIGKPLIIGHRGRRGVVSTCSYEARKFGVHSAMPSVTAERLCPGAVWRPGQMGLYSEVSRAIRRILDTFSPLVEPLSIDEAFLDLTGIAKDLDGGSAIAAEIKRRIRSDERLVGSAGVAPNKFLAKLASDLEKPDGLVVFPIEDVPTRLWPLPVERLWGVGPKTGERLRQRGIVKVGDILRAPVDRLISEIGESMTRHLRALARGDDDRPVVSSREAKSISEERTYGDDLTNPDDIDRALLARSEGVARELRHEKLRARTIHLKIRTGDFTTWTRSFTLDDPTDLAEVIVRESRRLLRDRIDLGRKGIRLLGIGVSGLLAAGSGQAALFADPSEERTRRLAEASDAVRKKFGERSLGRARLVAEPKGEDDGPAEASSLPAID